jgi:hypothetical protein
MIRTNLFKIAALASALLLIFSSLAFALDLSVTSSGNGVSSNLDVKYGATKEDALRHHIEVDARDGTLTNSIEGTGSLPLARLQVSDFPSIGYAGVERRVSGVAKLTSYKYDWGTYNPTGGVGTWLSLDAANATYISWGRALRGMRKGITPNLMLWPTLTA